MPADDRLLVATLAKAARGGVVSLSAAAEAMGHQTPPQAFAFDGSSGKAGSNGYVVVST